MNNYEQQAIDFLNSTNTTLSIEFLKNDFHFENDNSKRDIYNIIIQRGNRRFSFKFGQSVANSQKYVKTFNSGKHIEFTTSGYCLKGNTKVLDVEKYISIFPHAEQPKLVQGVEPTAYDILACLEKYEVGTFEDFCDNFGYDLDSRSAKKTYKAVLKEYKNVCKIWNESELEQLQEIN